MEERINKKHSPQADAIEVLLEILSANTPVPSTPKRQPSSSTAANPTNDIEQSAGEKKIR